MTECYDIVSISCPIVLLFSLLAFLISFYLNNDMSIPLLFMSITLTIASIMMCVFIICFRLYRSRYNKVNEIK